MSKTINKIRNLGSGRKVAVDADAKNVSVQETQRINTESKKISVSEELIESKRTTSVGVSVGRLLSMDNVELAKVAIHTAYVDKVRLEKTQEAELAVKGYKTDPKHAYLRDLVEEYSKLKAEVEYARAEINGIPLSHSHAKAVDPVAFMGSLSGMTGDVALKEYVLDIKNDFVGANWHAVEESDGIYWRWSGPSNSSTVVLPSLGGGKLRFELQLRHIHDDTTYSAGLRIYVNGREVELDERGDDHIKMLSFVADVEALDVHDKIVLRLEVERTYSPKELRQDNDTRKLGLALFRCAIFSEETGEN